MPRSLRFLPAAAVLCLLIPGCFDRSSDPIDVHDYHFDGYLQDSPENCLANVHYAYQARDLDTYTALFSDDFEFHADSDSLRHRSSPVPPAWGRTEEVTAADRMFHSEEVDKIELSFVYDTPVEADSVYPGAWEVHVTQVNLTVHARNQDAAPLIHRVENGSAILYFKEYPGEHVANGHNLWRIVRWEDSGGEPMTWAEIKALYLGVS